MVPRGHQEGPEKGPLAPSALGGVLEASGGFPGAVLEAYEGNVTVLWCAMMRYPAAGFRGSAVARGLVEGGGKPPPRVINLNIGFQTDTPCSHEGCGGV